MRDHVTENRVDPVTGRQQERTRTIDHYHQTDAWTPWRDIDPALACAVEAGAMTGTTSYVAEPDPSFSTCDTDPPPWRVRASRGDEEPWTVCQGLTRAEALACERALSALPGAAPVDEVARRRLEGTTVKVVSRAVTDDAGVAHELPVDREDPADQVSSAPFVPYSAEDVAEAEKAARWLLEKKLAPSAVMAEVLARAVLTLARMAR